EDQRRGRLHARGGPGLPGPARSAADAGCGAGEDAAADAGRRGRPLARGAAADLDAARPADAGADARRHGRPLPPVHADGGRQGAWQPGL
ncbi:MAG: hypothetical protein AVDCRST_MAG27-2454, partial [uncultured Craurococcus sp.]